MDPEADQGFCKVVNVYSETMSRAREITQPNRQQRIVVQKWSYTSRTQVSMVTGKGKAKSLSSKVVYTIISIYLAYLASATE